MISQFEVYALYVAIKNHFTTESYNYFKYRGKTTVTKESLISRNDQLMFKKIGKKYQTKKELENLFVSNFSLGKMWIGEFLEDDAWDNYLDFRKYQDSFTYSFEQELLKASQSGSLFKASKGQYPLILQLTISRQLSMSTFATLNEIQPFFADLDASIGPYDPLWRKTKALAIKLHPFLEYDKVKVSSVWQKVLDQGD